MCDEHEANTADASGASMQLRVFSTLSRCILLDKACGQQGRCEAEQRQHVSCKSAGAEQVAQPQREHAGSGERKAAAPLGNQCEDGKEHHPQRRGRAEEQ